MNTLSVPRMIYRDFGVLSGEKKMPVIRGSGLRSDSPTFTEMSYTAATANTADFHI